MSDRASRAFGRGVLLLRYVGRHRNLYIMLIPCVAYFLIFHYVPMYGVVLAFKDFSFAKGILGSAWAGLANFSYLFGLRDFYTVFWNSLIVNVLKMVFFFPAPIVFALLLNEIRSPWYKKTTQTLIYLPYFISWVVIGGILINFLSPTWGVVNELIKQTGSKPIFFMAELKYFRPLVVLSEVWKNSGWDSIIYLAAISTIQAELYEAAVMDGAGRWTRMFRITLPQIKNVIIIMGLLRIGHLMHNGFEQIFILQNYSNLPVSEVFETYTYKIGILSGRISLGTAAGLFTSVIGMILLIVADRLAKLSGEDGLF
jgi:putative aldouronate transport system permease protein